MRVILALVAIILLGAPVGCGDHEGGIPGSATTKKDKAARDAGLEDVGHEDAGPEDAGLQDAEPEDAATTLDATLEDSGPIDAGPAETLSDASAPLDASTEPPSDAAPGDAGVTDASTLERIAIAVDTIAPKSIQAGQEILVLCLLQDSAGEVYLPPASLKPEMLLEPSDGAVTREGGALMAARSGSLSVACSFPSLGVSDATPAVLQVSPGVAARTTITLERDSVTAGESVTGSCQTFDAWGNGLPTARPRLNSSPADTRNRFVGSVGTFERAGSFELQCDLDGATSAPATLTVMPGLPAELTLTRAPDKTSYALGEVIQLNRAVADRFGNRISSVSVPVTSEPAGTARGEGRFSYSKSGRYRLTATVAPPTEGDAVITKSEEILVDGVGPSVSCDSPLDGEVLNLQPGSNLVFRGSASDPSGIAGLRVNGVPTSLDAAGNFTSPLLTHFGINFVDIAAVDRSGQDTNRHCAFLVSDRWASESEASADTLSLRLRQAAVDDASRSDLDSLGDVFHQVLASDALRDSIDDAMLSQPVLKSGCDQSVFGVCVLSSQLTYVGNEIAGPNQVHLALTQGGLDSATRVENLSVELLLEGQAAGLAYRNRGTVEFESIDVGTTFDIVVAEGSPRVRVRSGSTATSVGRITTDFAGIEGELLNAIVGLANDVIREYVAMRVQIFVTDNLNQVLDGVIASLDVESLGEGFNVTRLDSSATIPLEFKAQFSSVSSSPARLLFGLGTRFTAPAAHARPSLGIPIPSAERLLDISGADPVGVAIHALSFGQGLHALWRAGYFDAMLDSTNQALGMPEGMQVEFSAQLPPVVELQGTRVELTLGSVSATLTYSGLLAGPVPMTMGARASMLPRLQGDSIVFEDFRLDELHLAIDAPELDPFTRAAIEGTVPTMLEYVVANAMHDSLPALPLPSFTLPAGLAEYGLAAGARWGISDPVLLVESPHFALRGEAKIN